MPDKQQWKDYRKAIRQWIKKWKDHLEEVDDFIDDMDSEGQTTATAPAPPVENPPPPPNPE